MYLSWLWVLQKLNRTIQLQVFKVFAGWKLGKFANVRVTRLGNFLPIGLLLEALYDFWKDEVVENNGDFLGYFLFKQIYYIIT
jgi:hypothetical protein